MLFSVAPEKGNSTTSRERGGLNRPPSLFMKKQFKFIIGIQFLIYMANGLFAPAWYRILIERGGTIDQFGLLLGLMAIGSVASAYFVGYLSEYKNPLKVLAMAILLQGLVMVSYIPILSLSVIYLLQILFGMLNVAVITLQQILVAQHSKGNSKQIGLYNSIMQGTAGVSMIAGGFIAVQIGSMSIMWVAVAIFIIAALGSLLVSKSSDATVII